MDIPFLETMLQYYLPGLDTSQLSDEEFALKLGYLQRIREMEQQNQVSNTLQNLFK